jgi:hypothetical protein
MWSLSVLGLDEFCKRDSRNAVIICCGAAEPCRERKRWVVVPVLNLGEMRGFHADLGGERLQRDLASLAPTSKGMVGHAPL